MRRRSAMGDADAAVVEQRHLAPGGAHGSAGPLRARSGRCAPGAASDGCPMPVWCSVSTGRPGESCCGPRAAGGGACAGGAAVASARRRAVVAAHGGAATLSSCLSIIEVYTRSTGRAVARSPKPSIMLLSHSRAAAARSRSALLKMASSGGGASEDGQAAAAPRVVKAGDKEKLGLLAAYDGFLFDLDGDCALLGCRGLGLWAHARGRPGRWTGSARRVRGPQRASIAAHWRAQGRSGRAAR